MEHRTHKTELPLLPGHSYRAWRSFFIPFSAMALGIALFGFGVSRDSNLFQIGGAALGLGGFIGMVVSFGYFQSARCPECRQRMSQGWDSKEQRSDGIFTCQSCEKSWQTDATWGSD